MKRTALVVGIDHYEDDQILDLVCAEQDAMELYGFLKWTARFDVVEHLPARSADDILDTAATLCRGLTPGDLFMFYFAGHGVAHQGRLLLLCSKARAQRLEYFQHTVPVDLLKSETAACGAARVLLLDCCRSNLHRGREGVVEGWRGARAARDVVAAQPRGAGPLAVLCACDEGQQAQEVARLKQGLFSRALIDELSAAVQVGRELRLNDALEEALRTRMGQLAGQFDLPREQRPWIERSGEIPVLLPGRSVEEVSLRPTAMQAAPPLLEPERPSPIIKPFLPQPPPPSGGIARIPEEASRERPWENSLGMRFVPVPGTKVLFCVWETRVQDYGTYAKAKGRSWEKPGFDQGPTHPAVNVSWEDAKQFCLWLTEQEWAKGVLAGTWDYRLPTDFEWSAAVGLPEEKGQTPEERDARIQDHYPWGTQWPPRIGVGNYAPSLLVDSYDHTSPVGSFKSNRHGLYDLGGNVWELCEDFFDGKGGARVLRGASWGNGYPGGLLSSCRDYVTPGSRCVNVGFRVVLAGGVSVQAGNP
jgi:hypothetical protein